MLVPMAKVRLIGHKRLLDDTLALLHRLGVVHVIDIGDDSGAQVPPLAIDEPHLHEAEDLRYLRTRLDGLLGLTEHAPAPSAELVEFDAAALVRLREELDAEGPEFEALVRRLDDLERERETLPRYIGTLRHLLPLVPELTALESYETAALLVERRHADLLGDLNVAVAEVVGANYDIISDNVDADTVGAILVFPRQHASEVQALLGRGQLSRVHLPERFRDMPFRGAIARWSAASWRYRTRWRTCGITSMPRCAGTRIGSTPRTGWRGVSINSPSSAAWARRRTRSCCRGGRLATKSRGCAPPSPRNSAMRSSSRRPILRPTTRLPC